MLASVSLLTNVSFVRTFAMLQRNDKRLKGSIVLGPLVPGPFMQGSVVLGSEVLEPDALDLGAFEPVDARQESQCLEVA